MVAEAAYTPSAQNSAYRLTLHFADLDKMLSLRLRMCFVDFFVDSLWMLC
jgi:hypothetical protein